MLDFCAGTSFSPDERVSKNLTGLIPHVLESLETQCMRAMRMINSRSTNIDKYLYLSTLKQNNTDLFYRLLIDNVATCLPAILDLVHSSRSAIHFHQAKKVDCDNTEELAVPRALDLCRH
jgi:hypothetical protein